MSIRVHNKRGTKEYKVWDRIMQVCYNKNHPEYPKNGGSGITMCEKWKNDCISFMDDIGPNPEGKYYFQRIDRSKGFEPGNVEWSNVLYRAERGERRLSQSREHNIWCKIKARCYKTTAHAYDRYGGRGIKMYEPWINDFCAFYDYVGPSPSDSHSIDRIDNALGYEPGNIRWATAKEQSRNRRTNLKIQICCQTKTLAEWCEIYNFSYSAAYKRILKGHDILKVFNLNAMAS
jgi:hypothetical protein